MVSEGREYRKGVDKLFKVRSLERRGGRGSKFFFAFCFACNIENGEKKIVLDQAEMKP